MGVHSLQTPGSARGPGRARIFSTRSQGRKPLGRTAMRRSLGCSFAAVLLCGALPASTAGAEPPLGAAARGASVLEGAAGLEKPVSYSETKIPLGELVTRVAAETGAPLRAAPDVADEPVAVVVTALPARELLQQLAG